MSNLERTNEKHTTPSTPAAAQQKGLGRGLGSLFGSELAKVEFKDLDSSKEENKSEPIKAKSILPDPVVYKKEEPAKESEKVIAAPVTLVATEIPEENRIWNMAIEKLIINNFQPRKHFDKEKIQELSNSIKEQGILLPIVARKTIKGEYEIIAGERRWRAAQLAGLHEVPVILKDIDDQKSLELALIENIQRENLNAIEEAEAFERLAKEFNLTQQQISEKVGKDRTTITNILRLLSLAPEVKNMVIMGELSTGHAKALLAITDPVKQREVAKKIASEKLTVRAAEKLAKSATRTKDTSSKTDEVTDQLITMMGDDLQKALGTKVKIDYSKGIGKISVFFYSDSELTQISERFKKTWTSSETI